MSMNGAEEAEALSRMAMGITTEAVTQVFRITLNGSIFVVKAVGKEAINLFAAAVKGDKKTSGQARLASLLKSGKPLKIYTFREDQIKDFASAAKRYGIVYSMVKRDTDDKNNHVYDVMVKAEDAPKLNRVFEKINYATVADVTAEETTEEKLSAMEEKLMTIHELQEKMLQPRGAELENPELAVSGEYQYTASSNPMDKTSVYEKLEQAKEAANAINQNSQGSFSSFVEQMLQPKADGTFSESEIGLEYVPDIPVGEATEEAVSNIPTADSVTNSVSVSPDLAQGVLKNLGINRTMLTQTETQFVTSWKAQGISDELILHACDRASTSKPNSANIHYVNGIIENWSKNNVKTIEDVNKLSVMHASKQNNNKYTGRSYTNNFNDFTQSTTGEQINEFERLLRQEVNGAGKAFNEFPKSTSDEMFDTMEKAFIHSLNSGKEM